MYLWIALSISFLFGLLHPFSERLEDTSLWAGKALVPYQAASSFPKGLQGALINGWPGTYIVIVSFLPYIGVIIGFFYVWWAGIVAYVAAIFLSAIFSKTQIASHKVERYIEILTNHARNRVAYFNKKGDIKKADAAEELTISMEELLSHYFESDIPVPTHKQAKNAPFGEQYYLFDLHN